MAYRFKIGDHVRVARIEGSSWQGRNGSIVDVIVRYVDRPVQECAVILDGDRRWFMEGHLTRTISPKGIRFFRSEAVDRWNMSADTAASLTGELDQLVDVLCTECNYTIPRAQSEAEAFYDNVDKVMLAESACATAA